MKLTLDSSEPLEDAIRMVGALYGVTLVTAPAPDQPNAPAAVEQPVEVPTATVGDAQPSRSGRRRSSSKATKPGPDANGTRQVTAASMTGSPNNTELRSWARANGLTVSDRGRVPASVQKAYADAHNG